MGLFVIDGEYDFAVHVSPTLSENILNEKYVDPATIFEVDIMFEVSEQDPVLIALLIWIISKDLEQIHFLPFVLISTTKNQLAIVFLKT